MVEVGPLEIQIHATCIYPSEPAIYFSAGTSQDGLYRLDTVETMYNKRDLSKRDIVLAKALLKLALEELEEMETK